MNSMSTFKIPVACIGETGYVFDACAPVTEIQPPDTLGLPIFDVTVHGCFTAVADTFLFRGTVSGAFTNACFRCLAPARAAFNVTVAWVFRQGEALAYEELEHAAGLEETGHSVKDRKGESCRPFQGPEIDLAPCIWEELVFAQPSRFLCEEDCKGMCPGCGINLNTGACTCTDTSIVEPEGNTGLASLARLFPELAPEKKKE